jgi:hypothetical protein
VMAWGWKGLGRAGLVGGVQQISTRGAGRGGERGEDGRAVRGGRGLRARIAAAEARARGGAEVRTRAVGGGRTRTVNAYVIVLRSSRDILVYSLV